MLKSPAVLFNPDDDTAGPTLKWEWVSLLEADSLHPDRARFSDETETELMLRSSAALFNPDDTAGPILEWVSLLEVDSLLPDRARFFEETEIDELMLRSPAALFNPDDDTAGPTLSRSSTPC